jgi:bacteriocin-like protein
MNRRTARQNLQPADPANQGFEIVTDEELKSVTGGIYLAPDYMIRRVINGSVYYQSYNGLQKAPLSEPVGSPSTPVHW